MAGDQKSTATSAPRCFKHDRKWQANVQLALNYLRGTLIKVTYIGRFNNLLCTCGQSVAASRPDVVGAWDEVSDDQFRQAVVFISNYIAQNPENAVVKVIDPVVTKLRADKEIPNEGSSSSELNFNPRSSAFKFLYLLQKAIEKDFKIMEPRKVVVQQSKKKARVEHKLEVELEAYPPEYLGQLIGEYGRNIMIFMKREKCHVRFEKVFGRNGREVVKAVIKKTTDDKDILKRIADELKKFAEDTKETVESYEPPSPGDTEEFTPEVRAVYEQIDEMNMMEVREEYIELLGAIPACSTTEHTDVVRYYREHNNTRYNAITKKLPPIDQIRALNDHKASLDSMGSPSTPVTHTTGRLSGLSVGPGNSTSSGTSSSQVRQSTTTPGAVQQLQTLKEPTSQMSASGPATLTQVATVDYNDPTANDPCPSKCLVHDRRWVSTYQYTLTQCYTHIRLQRKFGSKFSRLICTCKKPRPEARLYFVTEETMEKAFKQCKEKLERWPHECRVIMKPLISQLEKYDNSEVWHSLFKFVFYFNSVDAQQMDVLDDGHKLPGQTAKFAPRQEKPYIYQVNVATPSVDSSSAYTQALNTLSAAAAAAASRPAAAAASRPAAAAASSTVSSISAGATGVSIVLSSVSSRLSSFLGSMSSVDSRSKQDSSKEPKRKMALKRLRPEDWSEDCYYHGKKKKFAFQCLVNYLHKQASLPVKLNIPFSMAVCVCNETVDQKDFYKLDRDLGDDCLTMKVKLEFWRGDSKTTILPYIELCEKYRKSKEISPGFLKLVYYFNRVYKREMSEMEELHRLIKTARRKGNS